MSVYIIDTECTDLDEPEVIEMALIAIPPTVDLVGRSDAIPDLGQVVLVALTGRFCPSKPSSFGALAVHHILPHELDGHRPSSEASVPEDCEYLIGHNVDHDWQALGSPDVKRICTYAMAQHVWPDTDSYSQSALLYMSMGPTEETRCRLRDAHSAAADAHNCAVLLRRIIECAPVPLETWSALYEYSETCRIPLKMPFTKARGELLTEIDDGLLAWCLEQPWLPDERPYLYKGLMQEYERREAGFAHQSSDPYDDEMPF